MCQDPFSKPYHRQSLSGSLGMPKNAAKRISLISIRIMKFRSQVVESLFCAFYSEILIISAHLFDALVKNDEVHDKIDKALFIKHGIDLLQKLILYVCTFFTDTDIDRITLFFMLLKAVILPFHVELLAGQKC